MKRTVQELKKLIQIYGAARVAVWLDYRDTRPINSWVTRGQIPEQRKELVKDLINKHNKGKLK